jgi:hypothetical protein
MPAGANVNTGANRHGSMALNAMFTSEFWSISPKSAISFAGRVNAADPIAEPSIQ